MEDKVMKPLKDDRRTQKTKKLLAEALKELILEKGYDDITIQDIIDKANVGRSTFYCHYESKEELLIGNLNFQDALINIPFNDQENYPMGVNISYLFNHTKEHLHVGRAMGSSVTILSNRFTELCAARIFEYNKRQISNSVTDQKMLRYKAEAAAGGIIRMLFKWLDDGAMVPSDEMIAYARKIMDNCMS